MADNAAPASATKLPFLLGLAALASFVIGWIIDESGENGWIWFVMAALSIGSLITGFMVSKAGRPDIRTMAGMAVSGILLLLFVLFAVGVLE